MQMNSQQDNSGKSPYNQKQLFEKLVWDLDDVCEFSGYAKGTIYNKVSGGEIPCSSRRGRKRKLKFTPSEVIEWLKGD